MHTQVTLAAILACVAMVTSYPTGAPAGACGTLNPDSHGPSTAKGPSPYRLTFSSDTYKPGQVITLTLTGALFKGFLVVGRKAGDTSQDNIGFFKKPSSPDAQLQCPNATSGNGITHTNNTVKAAIQLDWTAPSSSVGDIVFHYTVVRGGAPNTKVDAADYFMDVKSSPLKAASETKEIKLEDLLFKEEWKSVAPIKAVIDEEEGEIIYAIPSGSEKKH